MSDFFDGLKPLDNLLNSIPDGVAIMFKGNRESGKQIAALFIADHKKALIINTTLPQSHILKLAGDYSIDLSESAFLDCVMWRIKRLDAEKYRDKTPIVKNLTDLNALLAVIMKYIKQHTEIKLVIFDSMSSLLIYSIPGKEQVYRFFELLITFFRDNNVKLIFTLEDKMHDDNIIHTLQFMSDGIVEFRLNKNNYQYKIPFIQGKNPQNIWIDINKY